ncbi:hypothetical protein [Arthrobacter sp. H5]|uniref:hypothetical protein n=1 Tax=Arthrobacter sp. H5 TaxID=1267973 RepID=UPI0004B393FC|nr:hypothetical protein [Arthrobacter sp. H5]
MGLFQQEKPAAAQDPDAAAQPWRRIGLLKSAGILLIPVLVLSVVSGVLFFALDAASPESFDDIHFWFYFFDVGREINVPTWFSSGMWIVAGGIAGYYARQASQFRLSWWLFATVCVVFSIDEMLELHERLDVIGHELSELLPFNLGFVWVIPGAILALTVVLLLLRLVLSLPNGVRNGLLAAGVVFVGGGLGFETLAGLALAENGLAPQFFMLTLTEETLEMIGIALCMAALVHLIEYRRADGGTTYRLAERAPRR